VSIASLQSNPWANPWATAATSKAAGTDQAKATFNTSSSKAPWSVQGADGNSTTSSPANALQSLASDIQAMLIQAQNTGTQGGATSGTTSGTTAQSPATALQKMLDDIQANTQTANSDATTPTGETQHHHHHRNIGGGEANAASDVASASTSSDTGTSATGSQPGSDQPVSSMLATEIAQAIQAYASGGALAAASALML
jgi:hypothetical protein